MGLPGHKSTRVTTRYSAAELTRLTEAVGRNYDRTGTRPQLVNLRGSKERDSRKTTELFGT
jgi:hypothetical protein